MTKHLSLLLPILTTMLAVARDDSGSWLEVRSPHFSIVTDTSEKQARHIAAQFERMRAIFEDLYPRLEADQESPVSVLAIRTPRVFRVLQPDVYLREENLKLRGWFLRDFGKSYILMRLDGKEEDPFSIAYHEYTHLLLHKANNAIPVWLDEGLAEFYGNMRIDDRRASLGEPNQRHLLLLRNTKLLPLTALFAVDRTSADYIEKNRGSLFYAESWALTHYLTLKDYENKTSSIEQYAQLVRERIDPVTAGMRAFGDLKKLQKTLDSYIQQENLNRITTTVAAKIDASEFDIQKITAVQAEAEQADFLASSGRLPEARALVKRVLEQDPDSLTGQETLEFLNLADEAQEEEELRQAVRAEQAPAAAYDRLAAFLWKRGNDLGEARRRAETAVHLDPGNVDYRINLANILLKAGNPQAAIETLRTAAKAARTPAELASVDQRLRDAVGYAAAVAADHNGTAQKATSATNEAAEQAVSNRPDFVASGPHRFLTGVLKGVRCEAPSLDLTIASRSKTLTLHSDNYYQIQFTALFTPARELQPCQDLENRTARVEYVESAHDHRAPRLIAVELRK
jgi:tetratricopeptide (TPR) repeat protein